MSSLDIQGLCVALGGHTIIEGLDLSVDEGEFLVLLGPSGCGKSTLLHSIAGLIDISAGSIRIGGEDVTGADPSRRHIGMVFQSYALYPTMTVERNLSFGLRVSGMDSAQIDGRVRHVARMLQLEPLLQRKPAALSGGQRQRVAIGRALVREARVTLFDEPLSNLDAQLRTELRRELKLLHRKLGSTMIYVTHDQVEAMTLATRVVVMHDGRVQQAGTPVQVYTRPANRFVAAFLGAPGMNFLTGRLQCGAAGVEFCAGPMRIDLGGYAFADALPAAEVPVVLGVRPEQLHLDAAGPFEAVVTLVEPMGNHAVIWLQCAGQQLAALAPGSVCSAVDDRVRFTIDATAVSLFDTHGGLRL